MKPAIAFIGIGQMGWPMAARLIQAENKVSVFDVTPGRCATFTSVHGGTVVDDLASVPQHADVIITMLPSSKQVMEVVEAILPAVKPGQVVIEMSSGLPTATQQIARTLSERGVVLVDAPVSGGVQRAVSGELAIMTGGDAEVLERVAPILHAMGTTITRIGDVGAGQAMKALNNLVSAGGFLIGIEALLIGQKFGLDPGVMTDVLNVSTGSNNSTQKKFKQFVLSGRFDSGFGLDLMLKDLSIATDIARTSDVPTPFSMLCRELATSARSFLGAGQDHTAFARYCEAVAGISLSGAKQPEDLKDQKP